MFRNLVPKRPKPGPAVDPYELLDHARYDREDREDRKALIEALRQQRLDQDLSQRDLGARTRPKEMGQAQVSEFESGKVEPRTGTIQKVARALGCRVELILVVDTERFCYPESQAQQNAIDWEPQPPLRVTSSTAAATSE
jgi:transcriptional regulator with XRE-family HTH domain